MSFATIQVERIRLINKPTCCAEWGNKEKTCPFMGMKRLGRSGLTSTEVCNIVANTPEIQRRVSKDGEAGMGSLIPLHECPVWFGYHYVGKGYTDE